MDASEQKLISDLFARMRGMHGIAKDRDAAALIEQEAAANPDAAYLLTQSVLVQEQALQQAQARITELEDKVDTLQRTQVPAATSVPKSSPGFPAGAVPQVGASGRSGAMGFPAGAMAANDTVGERGRGAAGQGGQSGGFMAQAMTTAAGVAGGMLLASGISSLLSGSSSDASSSGATETASATPTETQPATETASSEPDQAQDDNLQQASHDDSAGEGDWGFDDFGDFGDIDI